MPSNDGDVQPEPDDRTWHIRWIEDRVDGIHRGQPQPVEEFFDVGVVWPEDNAFVEVPHEPFPDLDDA